MFSLGAAAHGTVELLDLFTGEFRYTPEADFRGIDSFTYTITHYVSYSSSATATSNTGVVKLYVGPLGVNDTDTYVAEEAENDLIRVDIMLLADPHQQLALRAHDPLLLWYDPKRAPGSKLDGAEVDGVWQSDVLDVANAPVNGTELTVWVEWVGGFHGDADLRLLDLAAPAAEKWQDTVVFHSFESLVIAISGETAFGGSPITDQGTDGMAVGLINRGFDTQYFDVQSTNPSGPFGVDVLGDGKGAAYVTAIAGINHRSVTNIGIFGYSHGGGATYNLSAALDEYGPKDAPGRTFNIDATAYVDAIRFQNSFIPFSVGPSVGVIPVSGTYNPLAEDRRPPFSSRHGNWYQNTPMLSWKILLQGTSVEGSNPNVDLQLEQWEGKLIDHFNIDEYVDNKELLEVFMESNMRTR